MNRFYLIFLILFFCGPAICATSKISIVGLFKNKAIVEINGKRHVLSIGETAPDGTKLISADSKEAVLEIAGTTKSYTLGTHIGGDYKEAEARQSVIIAPDQQGMYYVNGSINDFQVRFVVDTGASLISMNKHQAKRIGLQYKMEGEEGLSSTASGLDKIYIMPLQEVMVGDILLRDITAAVHDGDFPSVILLGNSFLNKLDIIRKGKLLELQNK